MSNLVSNELIKMTEEFEGFYEAPYIDCVGVKTLGYGFIGEEIEDLDYISQEDAEIKLINLYNNKYCPPLLNDLQSRGITLTQNEFDAISDMAYNVGYEGVLESTLYKNICAGIRDVDTITSNFLAWSYGGGVQLPGLVRRRKSEAAMFFDSGNIADAGYSKEFIISVQHDLQKVSCLILGEENADGIIGPKTKEAIKQFRYVAGLPDGYLIDSRLVNALNSVTKKPCIGLGWPEIIYATRFIQWFLGLEINGTWDDNMVEKIKEFQVKAGIWSASGADGVVREKDWDKILK